MKGDTREAAPCMQPGLLANLSGSLDRLKATVDHALPAVRCALSQSVCCPADRRHNASAARELSRRPLRRVGHACGTATYHLHSAVPCDRPFSRASPCAVSGRCRPPPPRHSSNEPPLACVQAAQPGLLSWSLAAGARQRLVSGRFSCSGRGGGQQRSRWPRACRHG